jgi:ribose/xylose/arabinose/galactoside ABC-type transport system permease subunit
MNMWHAILLVFLLLTLCGLLNGSLIGFLKINPILVTLGTSSAFTGLAMVFSEGKAISGLPEDFLIFGHYHVGVIPYQALILLIILVLSVVLLNFTQWGRRVYLIGSNPEIARFAGINCGFNIMLVYVYSAVLAFFAALILTSRLATGRADLGNVYLLQSVSAAVFGGIGIYGGTGNVFGAVLGVAIFAIISNGFNMLDFSQYSQQILIGCILITVLAYRMWRTNK